MAHSEKRFCLEVHTPSGKVAGVDAVSVVFPATDGMVGVLANRSPLVAQLGSGRLDVEQPDGKRLEFFVAGGFVQIRDNAMTVLAEECLPVANLDAEAARVELVAAEAMPGDNEIARNRRKDAVTVAKARLHVAETAGKK
jgi:F-type H+-transporting ATPase subunit epsilon